MCNHQWWPGCNLQDQKGLFVQSRLMKYSVLAHNFRNHELVMHFVPSSGRTARLLLPCCSKWESILLVYADPIDLATSTASNEWSPPGMPCENGRYLMAMNAPWPWEDTSRSNKTSVGQFTQLAPPQTASPGTSHLACCTHVNGNNIDSTLADHRLLSAFKGWSPCWGHQLTPPNHLDDQQASV